MENAKSKNLDGFVVRRRPAINDRRLGLDNLQVPKEYLMNPELKNGSGNSQPNLAKITDDMSQIQPIPMAGKAKRNSGKHDFDLTLDAPGATRKKRFALHRPTKKAVKRTAIVLLVLAIIGIGYFGWKFFVNSGRVFNGNPLAFFTGNKELKKDQYGRTNILLFGTSEDDAEHEGADLTDSIMIASLDQEKKNAFMVSVPRDLWVKYGQACNSGYEGKINEVYMCNADESEEAGQAALRTKVGEVFGLDLQYSVHVNYTVLKEAVDAVGGITVKIDSPDPRGILDRNFDWKCGYKCYYVKHKNGPAALDGEHALALARARNAAGGYGLTEGNFDREKYQQRILVALKEKATSAGTLANPVSVSNLLDSLGNNVRTNIAADEVNSLVVVAREVDASTITQLSLNDEEEPLVTTGNVSGASVVRPVAGLYNYSELQQYIRAHVSGDKAALEGATITVLNGSGVPGAAQKKADELMAQGLAVDETSNAPAGTYGSVQLYDLSKGTKPATKEKLEKILGVSVTTQVLPSSVTSDSDFVIIIGSNGAN
jgi:LCP family protein required for cell wall assembly